MVQVLNYIPLLNATLPPNMNEFLKQYLTVASIKIPFSLLPDFIPNPLEWVSGFLTNPFNDRFQLFGLDSISFIWNFAEQLYTWAILLLIYVALTILSKCVPSSRYARFLLFPSVGANMCESGKLITSTTP
jgi:hypothetical protein